MLPLTDPVTVYVAAFAVPEIAPVEKSSDVMASVLRNEPMFATANPSQLPRTSTGPAASTADVVNARTNAVARTRATTSSSRGAR